jgi:hypothetical protein
VDNEVKNMKNIIDAFFADVLCVLFITKMLTNKRVFRMTTQPQNQTFTLWASNEADSGAMISAVRQAFGHNSAQVDPTAQLSWENRSGPGFYEDTRVGWRQALPGDQHVQHVTRITVGGDADVSSVLAQIFDSARDNIVITPTGVAARGPLQDGDIRQDPSALT